jgi:hypothetical protein
MASADRVGFGSEWATAFGLALKMTKGQFAPRDGKPRDPAVTTAAPAPVAAEVVDIAKAVEAGSPAVRTHSAATPVKEEVHA